VPPERLALDLPLGVRLEIAEVQHDAVEIEPGPLAGHVLDERPAHGDDQVAALALQGLPDEGIGGDDGLELLVKLLVDTAQLRDPSLVPDRIGPAGGAGRDEDQQAEAAQDSASGAAAGRGLAGAGSPTSAARPTQRRSPNTSTSTTLAWT
jgi:hypothetical protein